MIKFAWKIFVYCYVIKENVSWIVEDWKML